MILLDMLIGVGFLGVGPGYPSEASVLKLVPLFPLFHIVLLDLSIKGEHEGLGSSALQI